MGRHGKDGRTLNLYFDRTLYERLKMYADDRGQTVTLALERIVKQYLDAVDAEQEAKNKEGT